MGVVFTDSAGIVEAALNKNLSVPLGPIETKAMALEEGVRFAWEVGICDTMFESDSKIISGAVLGNTTPPITVANVILGIQQQLQVFRMVHVSHVKWQGNKPAHILAHYAKGIDNYVAWIKENPSIIESLLAQDVMGFSSS